MENRPMEARLTANKYFMATETEDALEVLIFGDITSWEWLENDVSSYTLAKLLSETDAKKITVRINSYGGEVAEALAIYNALREKSAAGAEVTTTVEGFACSAAAVVFCAGDRRIMKQASLLMIHNAWARIEGNAKDLRKEADNLDKISNEASKAFHRVMAISETESAKERVMMRMTSGLKLEGISAGKLQKGTVTGPEEGREGQPGDGFTTIFKNFKKKE